MLLAQAAAQKGSAQPKDWVEASRGCGATAFLGKLAPCGDKGDTDLSLLCITIPGGITPTKQRT